MPPRQLRIVSRTVLLACAWCALAWPAWAQGAKKTVSESHSQSKGASEGRQAEPDRDGSGDHVQERQQWLRSGRTALGENAADLLHRAYQQKMKMRASRLATQAETKARTASAATSANRNGNSAPALNSIATAFSSLTWSNLGPSPIISDPTLNQSYGAVTGRVTAIAVDQKDATGNTVYVGGAFGGVWRSTNAASSNPGAVIWTPIFDAQPTLSIGAIAIQPGGSLILVGTGEPNSAGDSYYGMGIFLSPDGGASWQQISSANGGTRSFRGLGFSAIAFSSQNPNIVVASAAATIGASDGGEVQGAKGRGLYYSTDAGQSWFYANVQDPGGTIQPGSSNTVVFNPATNTFYAQIRFHGYYSSTDAVNWSRMPNQPGTALSTGACPAATSQLCPIYRADLTVRNDTGEMYTIFVDSSANTTTGGGIYKSTPLPNQPITWIKLGQAGIDACGDTGPNSGCGTQQGTFNLYLRAVPNGSTTDLYMGAINIFKCSASPGDPFCKASGAWKNLTHAYGCTPTANPAHVHPDQHAIGYAQTNPSIIYFGNDGGLYRTLTSTALNSSSCAASNPFQNLNGGLGSLSEFVWFSQHPSDPGILLGGLQDNGSPVSNLSGGIGWSAVNNGDGGFNAIDPSSPNVFYTANTDVSIQRCASGTACDPSSWLTVVGSGTVGGDTAAFYMPYLLDPQNTANLILGTCRIWRGPGVGGQFTPLSFNFSQAIDTPCTGNTMSGDTKIRAIAAGINTGSGSEVIYAGMVGQPPLAGHVFVTTNVDGGLGTWIDRSGKINPSAYDVSDIVVSPFDTTGSTAYLTIMGFGGGHIFKTTDAGATWLDKTGNLPDAPANSIMIDPFDPTLIYAGTDVGVFVSTDDGSAWSELGTGLPSVPAIKLRTFSSVTARKLRLATYGRGMWEVDVSTLVGTSPDLFLRGAAGTPITQTVSAGQTATFKVTLSSVRFTGNVSLVCTGAPQGTTCNINPGTINFSGSSDAAVAITVSTMARSANQPSIVGMQHSLPMNSGGLWVLLAGVLLSRATTSRQESRRRSLKWLFAPALLLMTMAGCGAGSSPPASPVATPVIQGTTAGTYKLTLVANAQGFTRTLNLNLVVQ